jgi:predicted RNase H-like HicB family nuclease
MDTSRYPSGVFWSDEDEGFIATAQDLPGCSAFGETQEEAIRELQDAITAWVAAAKAAGNPVPTPSVRPEFSGKFVVRVPKTLHASLVRQAKLEESSLNQYVVYLLAKHHEAHVTVKAAESWTQQLVFVTGPRMLGHTGGGGISHANYGGVQARGWHNPPA